MVLLETGQATTQTAIADAISRDQSTISNCFQSLKIDELDVSLVEKSGGIYMPTGFGERILDILTDRRYLGIDLESVEFDTERGKERIATQLAPLHRSRNVVPFLLLNAVAARHEIGRTRNGTQAVPLPKAAGDVENRLQKINRSTSRRNLRQIVDRFVDRNALTTDGDKLALTEKGQRQADLLDHVAEVVSTQTAAEPADASDSTTVSEIALNIRRGRLATSYSLENNDPELVDESHIYRKLKRIDVLDSPTDDWQSHRWVTVENAGSTPTTALAHKESGDTKITFEDLDPEAYLGGPDGQELQVEDRSDHQPAIEQKLAIYFPDPLPPGESRTVYYTLNWPDELAHIPQGELDQTISLTRYPLGVDELQFGIVDQVAHVGVDCEKFVPENDEYWECLSVLPEQIEANERPELQALPGEDYSGYLYAIESPQAPGYRIAYTLAE